MSQDIVQQIALIPLFDGLAKTHVEALLAIVVERRFGQGEMIFFEGDEGTGFYVIISGRVKIFKTSPDGKEQIIHIFGSYEPFAEAPIFAGRQFPANAQALEPTYALFFPRHGFVELIKNDPSLAMNMLAVLSGRLRKLTVMVEELSLKEAPARVASYLLYLSDKENAADQLTLDIGKGQLASLIGTSAETLSRIFQKMTQKRLITIDGPRIAILKRQTLQQLADSETRLI
jgi:CRP/FNR family transcriptional regulator